MLHEDLDKYRKMYSEFVDQLVNLHNRSSNYTKHPYNMEFARELRTIYRNIQYSAEALKRQTKLVYDEGRRNRKEYKKLQKYQSKKIEGDNDVNNTTN